MILKDFIPAPDVQEYIQLYRIVHLVFNNGEQIPAKAYPPRPEQCIAFYPYDRETVEYASTGKQVSNLPVVLYGQFTEVTHRAIGNHFLVVQIIFNPGALFRLTGIPANEFTNQYVDAGTVFNSIIHDVNEQLFLAKDYLQMIEIVNAFVRTLIKRKKQSILPIDAVCLAMLNSEQPYSIDAIAKQACYSNRQLERKFKERTGLNPKLFNRVISFDNAFRMKNTFVKRDWLRIAVECGYHDYQHLVKAYKDFTGLTPNAFHQLEEKAPERKFGLNEGFYKTAI
ncbi:MAG: Helix-turn-helix AraC domain-containing protein [Chitinophagaceae bacterium]|nr:MAG: Helix-turn-helix AraC domain-containing protein [Chitinophagaceae bacterium]